MKVWGEGGTSAVACDAKALSWPQHPYRRGKSHASHNILNRRKGLALRPWPLHESLRSLFVARAGCTLSGWREPTREKAYFPLRDLAAEAEADSLAFHEGSGVILTHVRENAT